MPSYHWLFLNLPRVKDFNTTQSLVILRFSTQWPAISSKDSAIVRSIDLLKHSRLKSRNNPFNYQSNQKILWTPNFTTSIYKAVLSNNGDLLVKDTTNNRLLWKSVNNVTRTDPPYKLSILDEGRVVVTSKAGVEVWESWPIRNMNQGMNIYSSIRICYDKCEICVIKVPVIEITSSTTTLATTTTTSFKTTSTNTATTTTATPTPTPKPEPNETTTCYIEGQWQYTCSGTNNCPPCWIISDKWDCYDKVNGQCPNWSGMMDVQKQGSKTNTSGSNSCHTDGDSDSKTNSENWNAQMSGNNGWSSQRGSSNGISPAITNGHSSSDTVDSRRSDSISDALTNSKTVESGWSSSKSDTVGNSYSHTERSTNTYSTSKTLSNEVSQSLQTAKSIEEGKESSINTQQTFTINFEFNIREGTCAIPAFFSLVEAASVAWACRDDKGKTIVLSNKVQALASYIPCFSDDPFQFSNVNPEYNNRIDSGTARNTLASGQILFPGDVLKSSNGRFNMELQRDGNLIIKRFTEPIWQSNIKFLANNSPRARITEKGHLIVEAKNFLVEQYRKDQYITVWSSSPMHLNYTTGVFGDGYAFILSDKNGRGVMYDGVGAALWNTNTRSGYKYPEEYQMPVIDAIYPTGPPYDDQIDPHNTIDNKVELLKQSSIISVDKSCSNGLKQNQGIVSPNGRFKFILEDSGNLVFKDGSRTMWSTRTAHTWYGKAPYKVYLTHRGEIAVKDSRGYVLWQSANMDLESKAPNQLE
ncbi:hypothetical protein CONCODRAFT_169882 [Conidiobolus coronatus NRRL 28638]|uniref:Bulb-type lectin domain-containing protein n=1 Tax=Conidiobolus coronatus (strain ATCC 28846 / CBS 209.66 / NRRL 28638) TaxID=796925 RepID=A0A137NQK2_CONC2|nr:hypothetical protein CONCODRAFT_169882 [Conidiobolus coronatus NRRL 28638]|eukprot:KXN65043.1 hypothetical protein CONCODRAFT_169882 [Conidiobolus coronatus NRRL 28638]